MTDGEPASPLRIGEASVPGTAGVIGMTLCPGKKGPSTRSGLLWVLLHCRGGLGRTGVVAARLLMEFGVPVKDAVRTVRAARPGTIETSAQERYLRDLALDPRWSRA